MSIFVLIDPPCWLLMIVRGLAGLGNGVRVRSRFNVTFFLLVEPSETALAKLAATEAFERLVVKRYLLETSLR
jgi:hypothetical protein